jgi:exodeoxyribonuclease V alpha subunit
METLLAGDELVGEVLGVVYADSTTGFGVVELDADGAGTAEATDEGAAAARCSGPLADLVEGQVVRLVGRWTVHPRYGRTFEASFYEQTVPTTVAGLRTFLLSERFDVDTRTVERLLTVFGRRSGAVIERDHQRLVTEAGLEPTTAAAIHEQWMQGLALADLVRLLEPAGIPYATVRGAFRRYGATAADVIREDPYALLSVPRCRFAHADSVARHLGITDDDPRRLAAAARAAHAGARRQEGHEYLTREQCIQRSASLLRADPALGQVAVTEALATGRLVTDTVGGEEVIYVPPGRRAERGLAARIERLLHARSRVAAAVRAPTDGELTLGQREAVAKAVRSPVSVITGGPGTGKTRSIAEIVDLASDAGLNIALCAPTGRAAKRVEELVGHPATTVHRLLDARPDEDGEGFTFGYGADTRLPHDVVVCDEVSMCDTLLAAALVAAVDEGAHLVLVGDPDQLPSVGSGDVLRDLVESGVVPTTQLVEVHRQAARSRIVGLARELNSGTLPTLRGVDGDVFVAEEPVRANVVPRIVEAVAHRIPSHLGVPSCDVQVIAPVYRGEAGVDALNAALKAELNPGGGGRVGRFDVGDRVMQTRNDPELDVSNGDIGQVTDTDRSTGELRVAYPRHEVSYPADRVGQLTHAWAITVHKSQGGEWPVVVFVCDRSHRGMLWRNLAYTAVTRAQNALIIVGQRAALAEAAAHDRPRNRQTGLAERLRSGVGATDRRGNAVDDQVDEEET